MYPILLPLLQRATQQRGHNGLPHVCICAVHLKCWQIGPKDCPDSLHSGVGEGMLSTNVYTRPPSLNTDISRILPQNHAETNAGNAIDGKYIQKMLIGDAFVVSKGHGQHTKNFPRAEIGKGHAPSRFNDAST